MMKGCVVAAALLTAAWAVPAVAAEGQEGQAAKEQKLICKSQPVTGSLLKKRRTCLTAEQWDQIATATRKNLGDVDRNSSTAGNSNGDNPYGGS